MNCKSMLRRRGLSPIALYCTTSELLIVNLEGYRSGCHKA